MVHGARFAELVIFIQILRRTSASVRPLCSARWATYQLINIQLLRYIAQMLTQLGSLD
jgi:hypothetical protein